jgi:hypothetical protein
MSEQPANGTEGWRQRIREAVNEDLLEVRYCQRGEEVDFLLVHSDGARVPAIDRFMDALLRGDLPPFEIRTIAAREAATEMESLRHYVRL